MPKKKKAKLKALPPEERKKDARWWFRSGHAPLNKFLDNYTQRYSVSHFVAEEELIAMGYYEELEIQRLTADGGEYEYTWCPYLDDLVPVAVTSHPAVKKHPASPHAPGFDDEDIPF